MAIGSTSHDPGREGIARSMKRAWRLAAAALLLAIAAFAAGVFFSRPSVPLASPLPPQAAVDRLLAASLSTPDGQELTLAHWRGQPLIVNFWATWCPPCLAEIPLFSRLQEQQRQVQFVGIALDTQENTAAFVGKNPVSYPLLLGSASTSSLMAELGNGRNGLPFTLGIDAHGQARFIRLGGLSEAETKSLMATLQ